jgi:tetratricopeptide (TPR) repeat protein
VAYTAVKLADVQKAIAAVTAAQKKYDTAVSSSSGSKSAVDKALKARDDALKKVESLRDNLENSIKSDARYKSASSTIQSSQQALQKAQQFLDSGDYLKNNTAYKNAVNAFNTAEQKLQQSYQLKDSGDYLKNNSTYQNALKAYQTADQKLQQAYQFKDSGDFLKNNNDYQVALKRVSDGERDVQNAQRDLDRASDRDKQYYQGKLDAANKALDARRSAVDPARERAEKYAESLIAAADKARGQAEKARDNAEAAAAKAMDLSISNADKARATAESTVNKAQQTAETAARNTFNTAQKAYDTANSNLDKVYGVINNEKQAAINTAQKAYDTADSTYNKANDTYQQLMQSFDPLLSQRNEAIGNVGNYINSIRGSLSDVTKFADAKQVQTLLGQIQTAVKGTKLDDLIKPVTSMISQIDPLKMAAIPKVNIPGANPDVFSNIDPNTGLPILDQGGLDSVLDRYKSNKIDTQQYRDNYNKFGWNVKSDASTAMRGPAIVGLDMGMAQSGMGQAAKDIVRAGTNQSATDADFKKAADQLGIDINDYYTTKETTGAYGTKSTAKVLDRQSLYNDIADRTKDFYMVANSIDGNKHAALLFRADGSGNLVPVTNEQGAPMANYYTATRNVTGETWYGDLLPIAAIAASFAMPGLSSALAGQIGAATGLGTAASGALAGAITNAGFAAITGGDIGKAALMGGAGSLAQIKAAEIADPLVGGASNIEKIAQITKLDPNQVRQTIAQGVATGLASAAVAPNNVGENILANVAGNFAGASAQNAVGKFIKDSGSLPFLTDVAGNVARVGTEAAVRGEDLSTALESAMPSIIASGASVQKDYAQYQKQSSQAALAEGQVGALDYRPTPDESQLKFYKVDPFGDPVYIGPDNETYTITPEGKVTLYADVTGYAQEPSGPDYSTIQGQAGAGALGSFGGVSGVPSGVGGLGIYGGTQADKTKTLPAVEVIGERDLPSTIYNPYPQGTEEYDDFEEYVKASQEFPLTPYDSSKPTGLGTIKSKQEAQAALQQANKVKQQQALTQQLLDPKSIYYLTPEEQEARGYFNPVQMFESVSPFRKGGLARMKRNTKWQ